MGTVVEGDFEWDAAKAADNLAKHGVSFEEAVTALMGPDALFLPDDLNPDRFIAIGASPKGASFLLSTSSEERATGSSARDRPPPTNKPLTPQGDAHEH